MPNLATRLGSKARAGARLLRARASWSQLPKRIDRLTLVPVDVVTPDRGFLDELAAGQLVLDGTMVEVGRLSPFAIERAPEHWTAALHGFRWLAHLRRVDSDRAQRVARALVSDWLTRHRRPSAGLAWRPDVVARRITAWLCNAHLLLDEAEAEFYRSVLGSLAAQARHLDAGRRRLPAGRVRVDVLTALLQLALASDGADRHIARLMRDLGSELSRQVLPDGCHLDRNPGTVLGLLLELLPLRQCLVASNRAVPAPIAGAIERMSAFLRHVTLGDGELARFNGMGRTPRDLLSAVLAQTGDGTGVISTGLMASGFARLAAGGVVVVADVGALPPLAYAVDAHAGCLSFEMTVDGAPMLRNCGAPGPSASTSQRATARATASHNALVLDARSSARLVEAGLPGRAGAGSLAGLERVEASVGPTAAGEVRLEASHDGYRGTRGLVHRRRLTLSLDGTGVEGIDELAPPSGVLRLSYDLPFAIYFHLAVGIEASVDQEGRVATATLASGEQWTLTAAGARIGVEASVDFAHVAGPVASRAIVLRAACPGESRIVWSLQRKGPSAAR